MKKFNLAFALFPFLLAAVCACKQETPKNDADIVDQDATDADMTDNGVDLDVVPDDADKDGSDGDDTVTGDDSPLLSDDGTPDEDTFCPSLEKVELPFRDAENNIHFCRPCDLPAKTDDPKCVRNLWDAANKKLATDYPAVDCYPYPCVIEGMEPYPGNPTLIKDCDMEVAPLNTTYGIITYKHYSLGGEKLAWTLSRYGINQGGGIFF